MLIASDGQTGIATAESAHPSLIILDMLMPGLDGVEVLRRLKRTASTSNIPVLVLSGLSQKNADKLILEGACDYCEKGSLTPEILESAVTKALAQRWTVRAAGKPSYTRSFGAIVAGERDPWKLAALSHPQIQASQEEVATAPVSG